MSNGQRPYDPAEWIVQRDRWEALRVVIDRLRSKAQVSHFIVDGRIHDDLREPNVQLRDSMPAALEALDCAVADYLDIRRDQQMED